MKLDISTILRLNETGKLSTADAEAELAKIFAANGMDNPTVIEAPAEPVKAAEVIGADRFISSLDLPPLIDTGFTASIDRIVESEKGIKIPLAYKGRGASRKKVSQVNVVYRDDTEAYLGHVGKGYAVVQNEIIYNSLNTAVKRALNCHEISGAILDEKTSHGGGFCSIQYRLPELRQPVNYANGNGTELDYTVGFINTFDGSSSLQLRLGCYDLVCTNGMLIGDFNSIKGRHTAGINMDRLTQFIQDGLNDHKLKAIEFERMSQSALALDDAKKWLLTNREFQHTTDSEKLSRLGEAMLNQFEVEATGDNGRGFNVFALTSALTYYSSHNDDASGFKVKNSDNEDNVAAALIGRENTVQAITSRDSFKALLTAAA